MRFTQVVCLAALAASLVDAQDTARADNQLFRIPPGWSRTDVPGSTILSPDSAPKNLVVLLLSGRALAGDFNATFDHDVNGLNGGQRVVSAGARQSRRTPDGIEQLGAVVELQGPNGARSYRYYLAAAPPGRFEMLVYMAATPVLFKRYLPDVERFIASWTFASLGAAPAAPGAAAPLTAAPPAGPPVPDAASLPEGRLEGVYEGYKYIFTTVLGAVQRKAVRDFYTFFADGTVYWGLPRTGMVGFDIRRAAQTNPQSCGTYQMNGDQVSIVVNRGTYRVLAVRSPGGLTFEDRPYLLQGDPAKTATHALEGVFVRADARPGEDLARKFIRFTRDGQFIDQGIVQTLGSTEIVNGNLQFERAGGAGTYRLSLYTLILRYSDGYQRQLPVTIKPAEMDKPSPSEIFVNTYTLVRR